MNKIVFATRNKGKLKEVSKILDGRYQLISLLDFENLPEIDEDQPTFEGNSKKKAVFAFENTGLPSIGDDSGLVVEQLNGEPGVISARYAGANATDEENNTLLLQKLSVFSEPHHAKFVCCAVYFDGRNYLVETGELPGKIVKEASGTNGFGYDPIFVPDGYSTTVGILDFEEKNKISHRAKAFNKLKQLMESKL